MSEYEFDQTPEEVDETKPQAQNMEAFFKKNKVERENIFYPATAELCDKDGEPLLWEIKAITTDENQRLQEECMRTVSVRRGRQATQERQLDNNLYARKLAAYCTVFPNLNDRALQDSYGVMSAEDLITRMLSSPFDWYNYLVRVQEHSGLDTTFQDEVDEAKNS